MRNLGVFIKNSRRFVTKFKIQGMIKLRESEVVYLLLKKFSELGNFELKHVSTRGLDNNYYISDGKKSHLKSKIDWEKEILRLFPNQFSEIIKNDFREIENCTIFRNKDGDKEKEYDHYDIVLKNKTYQGDQRYFYIEAKGDGRDGSRTYIKGQIQNGLGQLILAGRKVDSTDKEEKSLLDIKVGANFCLAFPIEWKDKLCLYLNDNNIYHEICDIFGRKEDTFFKSLFELRFFLIGLNEVIIVNKNLKRSSILWQHKQKRNHIC